MGFKLKKKNASNHATHQETSALLGKFQARLDQFSKLFGDSEKSKPLILAAAGFLLLSVVTLVYLFYSIPRYNEMTSSFGQLKLLSQTIPSQAVEASRSGSAAAVNELKKSKELFAHDLDVIASRDGTSDSYQKVEQLWKIASSNIDLITTQQNLIKQLYTTNIAIGEAVPEVQAEYNLMVDQMARQDVPSSQVIIAKNQVFISERALRSINAVLSGGDGSNDSTGDFSADIETFETYLNAQLNGNAELGVTRISNPELRASIESIRSSYDQVLKGAAVVLLKNADQIVKIRQASNQIFAQSDETLTALNQLSSQTESKWAAYLPALFLILFLLGLIVSIFKLLALRSEFDKSRVTRLQDEYDRNQNAILRLLDEIADLADGDLRSYATVSEDFTGAIADSINFAIDQLRDLVSRIHETSQEVARYTQDTQTITKQLASASDHQANEIAGASAAIYEIVSSIDQVSANASESAVVAERSVKIATNGAHVVNRSIEGMDTIREQIQETSKRIKRLGESSQEIGNIVSLINDIADQTNILALNAAIQASMAGEAGRGFAVVADEVQRLAERSASATKQIETLVKTIQTDTNEAVISMEHTTSEVVRGANLAKDAGVALDEIQSVSNSLAKLISNISNASKLQSSSASQIADTMNVVQEITTQTTTATFDTARSVSELATMAESLRESVSDFKLPE